MTLAKVTFLFYNFKRSNPITSGRDFDRKGFYMNKIYNDLLEHIFYGKSKDYLKNNYYFLVSNDYYLIKLYTDKLVFENFETDIPIRDRRMLETLGYWLNDSTLNLDNIYMFIRLKALNNKDFVHWWTKYNFTIKIKRTVI